MHDPFVHTRRDGGASDSPRAIASSANIPDYRIGKRRIVRRRPPRPGWAVLLASERFRYTTGDIRTVAGGLPAAYPRW